MKKIFCAAIILAAAYTINAQEVVRRRIKRLIQSLIVHKCQLLLRQTSRQVILQQLQ